MTIICVIVLMLVEDLTLNIRENQCDTALLVFLVPSAILKRVNIIPR